MEKDGAQLSRAVLPGFFTVLHILLGRSLIDSYQEMTKGIIKRANGSLETRRLSTLRSMLLLP
jgi:hypothetical protein